jgi:acid phosphatase (class A)
MLADGRHHVWKFNQGEAMQKVLACFFLVVGLVTGPAGAADVVYISIQQVNLAKLLAPPPAAQSELQRLDLDAVLELQRGRTPSQAERAVADNDLSIFRIAGEVLGPNFTAARVPKTTTFFGRLNEDARSLLLATKDVWDRPRPFKVSTEVKAVGALPANGSYPSGHATRGYLAAILFATMVPEKSGSLFARGREYGQNRVLAGVHFPTDIEAGRIGATAMAAEFMQNAAFTKDLAEAKAELRRELGLSP